jgi:hypothetical protein
MKYQERYGGSWFHLRTVAMNAGGFVLPLFTSTFPPLFLFGLLAALVVRRRRGAVDWGPPAEHQVLLLYLAVSLLALVPTSPGPFYRYLTPLLPVLCLLLARPLAVAAEVHRLVGPALVGLFVLTGPLPDFVYELTHEYRGPVSGMVRHLQSQGHPGETVAVTYEDLPLAFYTDMRVIGGLTGADLTPARTADWIIVRQHLVCEKDRAVADYLERNVAWQDYQRVEIDAPDTLFDNREALSDGIVVSRDEGHPFRSPQGAPRLVIFRRIR